MTSSAKKKWDRIYSQKGNKIHSAVSVLTENSFLLPDTGTALDLACGKGANALFLARNGLLTDAWDISGIIIKQLQENSDLYGLQINAQEVDINAKSLAGCSFDVIVVSCFLDRSICDGIVDALNKDGLLFYQTYTCEKTAPQGPGNPDYLLAVNELITLFSPLRMVFYRENGLIGTCTEGLRNATQFIGQKL
jgi:SAM-dependent methyltransferase